MTKTAPANPNRQLERAMPSVDSLCRIRRLMAEPQDKKTAKKPVLRSIWGRRPQFR